MRALALPLPDALVRLSGVLAESAARLRPGLPPFNRDKVTEMMQTGWVCDGSRAQRELAFLPVTPHDEALARTARWYRGHGWL